MAQSVKCLTLDFGLDHDLMVHDLESSVGIYVDNMEPSWDSLSPSLSLPLPLLVLSLSLSLSQNK